jgi:cell division protein FtsB
MLKDYAARNPVVTMIGTPNNSPRVTRTAAGSPIDREWVRRTLRRFWFLAAMVLGLITAWAWFSVMFGPHGWVEFERERAELQWLRKEIERELRENNALKRRVDKLRTDRRAIEDEAIKQGFLHPGQLVFVLPQSPDELAKLRPPDRTETGKPATRGLNWTNYRWTSTGVMFVAATAGYALLLRCWLARGTTRGR